MSDLEPLVRAPPRGAREPAVTIGAAPSPHEASDLVSVEDAVRRATAERERLERLAAENRQRTGRGKGTGAAAIAPAAAEGDRPPPRAARQRGRIGRTPPRAARQRGGTPPKP